MTKQILEMKIIKRKKDARDLERAGNSPRTVALVAPRELSKKDVLSIFNREQDLREEFIQKLEQVHD